MQEGDSQNSWLISDAPPEIILNMVNLKFSVVVPRPLEEVFGYFSRFETISEWDPNVRESKLRRNLENRLGQEYDLITVWKG